jgi:DNA invertase Pin-like site-specific DNA recombinase
VTRDNKKYRTALYARLSYDQHGDRVKVETQLDECRKLAVHLGWTVVDTFCDNSISAYDGSYRPDFERLLVAMKAGQVDAVLSWDITRLYRSMKDLERFIDIAEAATVSIKTVKAGELDLSTSAGRMVARILGSVARQESELKGERRVLPTPGAPRTERGGATSRGCSATPATARCWNLRRPRSNRPSLTS